MAVVAYFHSNSVISLIYVKVRIKIRKFLHKSTVCLQSASYSFSILVSPTATHTRKKNTGVKHTSSKSFGPENRDFYKFQCLYF